MQMTNFTYLRCGLRGNLLGLYLASAASIAVLGAADASAQTNPFDGRWDGTLSCAATANGRMPAFTVEVPAAIANGQWLYERGTRGKSGYERFKLKVQRGGRVRADGYVARYLDNGSTEKIAIKYVGEAKLGDSSQGAAIFLRGTRGSSECSLVLVPEKVDGRKTAQVELAERFLAAGALSVPPRSIQDIVAILDKQRLADPVQKVQDQALASSSPPESMSKVDLGKFLHARAGAKERLGLINESIADLRQAEAVTTNAPSLRSTLLLDLGRLEFEAGSVPVALEYLKERWDLVSAPGSRANAMALSAYFAALAGYGKQAEEALSEAKTIYLQLVGGTPDTWLKKDPFLTLNYFKATYALLYLTGQYREALETYADMIPVLLSGKSGQPPNAVETGLQFYSRALLKMGRTLEAEAVIRQALILSLQRVGRNNIQSARMMYTLATVLMAQGRVLNAIQVLESSIDAYERSGVPPQSASFNMARLNYARALALADRDAEALALFSRVEEYTRGNVKLFEKYPNIVAEWSIVLLRNDRPKEALDLISPVVAQSMRSLGPKHYETAEVIGVEAAARLALGQREEAESGFRRALPILMSPSRATDSDESDNAQVAYRLRFILEENLKLLSQGGPADVAEAFVLSDRVRSRSVGGAMAASGARAFAQDSDLAELVRLEQDARKQIASLYGLLANIRSLPTEQQSTEAINSLQVQIDTLRDRRAELAQTIAQRFPQYAELTNPKPKSVEDVRALLRSGEALVATYVGEDQTYVWAVPHEGPVTFHVAQIARSQMIDVIAEVRSSLDPSYVELVEDILPFSLDSAYALYQALLAPIEASLRDTRDLLVVAHGPLSQIPFSLLVTAPPTLVSADLPFSGYRQVPWLARKYAVSILPSVAAFAGLRALPPGNPARRPFVGFGDPAFQQVELGLAAASATPANKRGRRLEARAAPKTRETESASLRNLPRLSDTAEEIESIGRVFGADPQKDIHLGLQASEATVRAADLSLYRVIAFATHGLVPGDLDGLSEPALALAAPQPGDNGDGLLTLGEILSLRLDADWVILSACNTAAADGAGGEAFSGLGRAFFYAGTRALLLSNWPVESVSARLLTTDLFRRQVEEPLIGRAEALRRSILHLIDVGVANDVEGNPLFAYAHPMFWAPFSLVGDGS
jgi:CHAT domain-containing protein